MNKDNTLSALEQIQFASESIFAAVHQPDEGLDLEQIKKKMDWRTPLCDWALGYLIGKGDVEIIEGANDFHVRRKWTHYPFYPKHTE